MAKKLYRLEKQVDAAMRRVGMDPTKLRKKPGSLLRARRLLLIAWLLPGIPPPGPFG